MDTLLSFGINATMFFSGFALGATLVARGVFYRTAKLTCQKHKDPKGRSIRYTKLSFYPIKPSHDCRYLDTSSMKCSIDGQKCPN